MYSGPYLSTYIVAVEGSLTVKSVGWMKKDIKEKAELLFLENLFISDMLTKFSAN
jgi:hypothetical protein